MRRCEVQREGHMGGIEREVKPLCDSVYRVSQGEVLGAQRVDELVDVLSLHRRGVALPAPAGYQQAEAELLAQLPLG
eukprot:2259953-Prymnesium_polylepis.1